ncbi:MAG: hypothetical protein ABEJ79_08810 [Halolamina sp.]
MTPDGAARGALARLRRRIERRLGRRLAAVDAVALGLAVLAGVVVFVVAREVFPYLSVNDDEGVYLLQASMLLEGQLNLYPGRLGPLVRPWFFVVADAPESVGGVRMYSKYTPPTAALFALSKALTGTWDAAVAAVGTAVALGVYRLTAAAFDRVTGAVAVAVLAGTPLFLVTTATHLSYAPATALNLLFAVAYVRAARRDADGDPRRGLLWAVVAGNAVGVAFFTRSYTAVLFAAPFVGHALWSLWTGFGRATAVRRRTLARLGTVAGVGLLWVGVTLGYNAVLTGDPLTFPYAAFAPDDGIGFGYHELLSYDRVYTPVLAAATTVRLLRLFAVEWTFAGPVGTVLFCLGVASVVGRRGRWRPSSGDDGADTSDESVDASADSADSIDAADGVPGCSPRQLRGLLLWVVVAVVLGEAYFWGTLNGLNNRLIHLLGPFYHYDLLLPLSAFGAAGAVGVVRESRALLAGRLSRRRRRALAAVALVVALPVVGAAEASVVGGAVTPNADRTANLAAAYEPFEERDLDDAVVFVPDPYGDWQQHPFQYLRNDPGFDGDAVYVRDEGAESDWLALNATGNRTPYRFTYRGEWDGATGDPVVSRLVELRVLRGERVRASGRFGVPTRATSASVRLATDDESVRYEASVPEEGPLTVTWTVGPDGARVRGVTVAGDGDATATLPSGASEVALAVTFVTSTGASVTYRQVATVDVAADRVRVVWPPETRVCRLTTECGMARTWVGPDGEYLSGVSVATNATAVNETATNETAATATDAGQKESTSGRSLARRGILQRLSVGGGFVPT